MKSCVLPAELVSFVDSLYAYLPDKFYLHGAIRKPEMLLLIQMILRELPQRTLEWGLGSGISAAGTAKAKQISALKNLHVVLDPFQEEVSSNYGLKCLERSAVSELVEFHQKTSEKYLLEAAARDQKFDLIFVDGDHGTGHKLADAMLSTAVLSPNGIICFHDSFFRSTSIAIRYLIEEEGFQMMSVEGEPIWKRRARGLKHLARLGVYHANKIAPHVHHALAFLRRSDK